MPIHVVSKGPPTPQPLINSPISDVDALSTKTSDLKEGLNRDLIIST